MQPIHTPRLEPPAPFVYFDDITQYLDSLGLFLITPGLERITSVLDTLNLRRPPFTLVQVVGTNGKGSTSTMLASLARQHGISTGLHTSPHFVSPKERITLNGQALCEEDWVRLGNKLIDAGGSVLSYFEFITVLAVMAFADKKVRLAIMETGLGGSWDATTALDADLVLLTPFAMDHQAVLGNTLREVAADKSGAIRNAVSVISTIQNAEAWAVISEAAKLKNAPLICVAPEPDEKNTNGQEHGKKAYTVQYLPLPPKIRSGALPMRLDGSHQRYNAALALAAWRHLGPQLLAATYLSMDHDAIEADALALAWLPGRFQQVAPHPRASKNEFTPCPLGWPAIILDGAHNSHAFSALGLNLARQGIAPGAIIFACLADKDTEQIITHLRALATGPIFVPPITNNPRSIAPQELAAQIGLNAVPASSMQEALTLATASMADRLPEAFTQEHTAYPLLICGSLYLLGDFFYLRPDCLDTFGR